MILIAVANFEIAAHFGQALHYQQLALPPRHIVPPPHVDSALHTAAVAAHAKGVKLTLEQQLWRAFCCVDVDGSRSLSKRELYRALEMAGIHGSQGQLLKVYRTADRNDDGRVDWSEFMKLGRQLRQLAELDPLSLAKRYETATAPKLQSESPRGKASNRAAGMEAPTRAWSRGASGRRHRAGLAGRLGSGRDGGSGSAGGKAQVESDLRKGEASKAHRRREEEADAALQRAATEIQSVVRGKASRVQARPNQRSKWPSQTSHTQTPK